MQTKTNDPLAVMDELAATYGPNATPFPKLSRVTEARAKVAELVRAANRVATNNPRTAAQIIADWDALRAALAAFSEVR